MKPSIWTLSVFIMNNNMIHNHRFTSLLKFLRWNPRRVTGSAEPPELMAEYLTFPELSAFQSSFHSPSSSPCPCPLQGGRGGISGVRGREWAWGGGADVASSCRRGSESWQSWKKQQLTADSGLVCVFVPAASSLQNSKLRKTNFNCSNEQLYRGLDFLIFVFCICSDRPEACDAALSLHYVCL